MTIERRPWLGFFDPATGRREPREGLTIGKIYTVTNGQHCIGDSGNERNRPKSDWGPPILARDELYMRLRNEAKVSHEAALEFIAACPPAGVIRRELESCNTGDAMLGLVVFSAAPRGHRFWFDAALRGGALRGGAPT